MQNTVSPEETTVNLDLSITCDSPKHGLGEVGHIPDAPAKYIVWDQCPNCMPEASISFVCEGRVAYAHARDMAGKRAKCQCGATGPYTMFWTRIEAI